MRTSIRLRAVARGVSSFKGRRSGFSIPWSKGRIPLTAAWRTTHSTGFRTGCTREYRRAPVASRRAAPGVRDVQSGHPIARSGVGVRRMFTLRYKREGAMKIYDHHVAEPGAQHQPRVPDVSQVVGGGAEGARGDDPGPDVRDAEHGARRGAAAHARDRHAGASRQHRADGSRSHATTSGRHSSSPTSIEAENSMGFHADQEAARVLAKSSTTLAADRWRCAGRIRHRSRTPRVRPVRTGATR
jgi:hypothetical protein